LIGGLFGSLWQYCVKSAALYYLFIYLFIYLKTDNAAAGNTGQKTATNVYPLKKSALR
jgi:hypothetical protein